MLRIMSAAWVGLPLVAVALESSGNLRTHQIYDTGSQIVRMCGHPVAPAVARARWRSSAVAVEEHALFCQRVSGNA